MNIKKGDVLKSKVNLLDYIVLTVVDGVYLVSEAFNSNRGDTFYTLEGLKETFELPEEKWMPEVDELYWNISCVWGDTEQRVFQDTDFDEHCLLNKNYFKTKEAAEAKLEEILKVLRESKEEADKEAREEADTLAVLKK